MSGQAFASIINPYYATEKYQSIRSTTATGMDNLLREYNKQKKQTPKKYKLTP